MKFLVFLLTLSLSAQAFAFDHSHAPWTAILNKNLISGASTTKLKYADIKANVQELNAYLTAVSAVTEEQYKTFSKEQKLAFLFNAYNAFTVKLIVSQDKIPASIKDIKERSFSNPLGNPWKVSFFQFLGKKSYLDRIEHEIARKDFDEPRLHFAFNCASIGCPSLLMQAFVAEKLEAQLDSAARSFLADSTRNRLDSGKKKLLVSKIFDWYGKDFEKSAKYGSLRKFLASHMELTPEQKKQVEDGAIAIEFLDYDWKINSAP